MKKTQTDGGCYYCGGQVSAKQVTKICTRKGQLVAVVEDVPAEVCEQCGERYYHVKVLKAIEFLLADRSKLSKVVTVPSLKYAA